MLNGLVKSIALDLDVKSVANSAKASMDSKIAEVGADIELLTRWEDHHEQLWEDSFSLYRMHRCLQIAHVDIWALELDFARDNSTTLHELLQVSDALWFVNIVNFWNLIVP